MDNHLSYFPILSLKEMALRRVVVILWLEPDVLGLIEKINVKPSFHMYYNYWRQTLESVVTDKLLERLPNFLEKQALHLVIPVGLQIRNWLRFHERYLSYPLDCRTLEKLCWTRVGIIDYRKTAEELLRFEMVEIVKRYQLACLYCLDDYIPSFWRELPEVNKRKFYNEDASPVQLHYCWPYILKGEHNKLNDKCAQYYSDAFTFQQHAFKCSVKTGNKAAAQYFFQKLTQEGRETFLFTETSKIFGKYIVTAEFPQENVADTFCYLLSQMDPEEQMRIFQQHPLNVLKCFLEWPWQGLLFEIADLIWNFLSADDYFRLLLELASRFKRSEYYFSKLFREFFIHSPVNLRKEFVDRECQNCCFYREFFNSLVSQFSCSETIKVIFRNIDAADRVKLVSSREVFDIFHHYILCGKWDRVEMCFREAIQSIEERETVKKAITGYLATPYDGQFQGRKLVWNPFFHLFDETVLRKRKPEDEAE